VLESSVITGERVFGFQSLKISFLRQYLLIKLILNLVGFLSLLIVLGCSESEEINCVSEESEAQIVQLQAEITSLKSELADRKAEVKTLEKTTQLVLIRGDVVIALNKHNRFSFDLPAGATQVRFYGSFKADQKIEVLLRDEANYLKWRQNSRSGRSVWRAIPGVSGDADTSRLKTGNTYYLIFYFAPACKLLVCPKQVIISADFSLNYQAP